MIKSVVLSWLCGLVLAQAALARPGEPFVVRTVRIKDATIRSLVGRGDLVNVQLEFDAPVPNNGGLLVTTSTFANPRSLEVLLHLKNPNGGFEQVDVNAPSQYLDAQWSPAHTGLKPEELVGKTAVLYQPGLPVGSRTVTTAIKVGDIGGGHGDAINATITFDAPVPNEDLIAHGTLASGKVFHMLLMRHFARDAAPTKLVDAQWSPSQQGFAPADLVGAKLDLYVQNGFYSLQK
jgi:hypothetical protein